MKKYNYLSWSLLLICYLLATGYCNSKTNNEGYPRNPKFQQKVWDELNPYFLPENHPIKKKLDEIFNSIRVTESSQRLKEAGFILKKNKEQHLVVASHPNLKGYLIKLYYDNHDITQITGNEDTTLWVYRNPTAESVRQAISIGKEASLFLLRILGMQRVQKVIESYHLQNEIVIPKKWLYPLPTLTSASKYPKNFILVVEDMDIVSNEENEKMYKEKMTPRLLNALYIVIDKAHLYDSIYIDNNPFTKNGKITFIDTEEFDYKPVFWEQITPFLSPEMQIYWNRLIVQSGPVP